MLRKPGNDYSQARPRFNRKCYIGAPQPKKLKPVQVEMVDPNKTRPRTEEVRVKRDLKKNGAFV